MCEAYYISNNTVINSIVQVLYVNRRDLKVF